MPMDGLDPTRPPSSINELNTSGLLDRAPVPLAERGAQTLQVHLGEALQDFMRAGHEGAADCL